MSCLISVVEYMFTPVIPNEHDRLTYLKRNQFCFILSMRFHLEFVLEVELYPLCSGGGDDPDTVHVRWVSIGVVRAS